MATEIILVKVAENGNAWYHSKGTGSVGTKVAVTSIDADWYVAAGHSKEPDDRFTLFKFTPSGGTDAHLATVIGGGSTWGDERSCEALAFGTAGEAGDEGTYLLVGRDEGDGFKLEACKFNGANLGSPIVEQTSEQWGEGRYAVTATFCKLDGKSYFAVGRNAGSNARILIYPFNGVGFGTPFEAGSSWSEDASCSSLAFCELGEAGHKQTFLAAARGYGSDARFIIYTFTSKGLTQVATGGTGWGEGRKGTAIAFIPYDDKSAYLAVGRNDGSDARIFIYSWDGPSQILTQLGELGESWGESRSCTALSFTATTDSNGVRHIHLFAGRDEGSGARVIVYEFIQHDGKLLLDQVADNSSSGWNSDYGVNGLAAVAIPVGTPGVTVPYVMVTRSAHQDARLIIYQLTTL